MRGVTLSRAATPEDERTLACSWEDRQERRQLKKVFYSIVTREDEGDTACEGELDKGLHQKR